MRNHVAKALWAPRYKQLVIKNKKVYTRKVKHKSKEDA